MGASGAAVVGAAHAAPSLEWAVKAEYLFKLIPFVDWPADAFSAPSDPFRVCVVGDDPFGKLLDDAGRGESGGERAIAVMRLKTASPDAHCQIMYVGGDPEFVTQSLASVSGSPVLTVTGGQNGDRGIINFVIIQNHVRFQVNAEEALRNHLNVSSKLLSIAVQPGNPP